MAARDEAAFEDFVGTRSHDLLRTAMLLARDRGHAEDLLQTALLKAYRHWHRITADDPYPYVRRILVTTAASRRRLRTTQEIVELPAEDATSSLLPFPDPTDEIADREQMTAALATLPPRMRAVLVLRYAEDLGEAATAEALGCSVATVKSQTARGLARLRTVLAPAPPTPTPPAPRPAAVKEH